MMILGDGELNRIWMKMGIGMDRMGLDRIEIPDRNVLFIVNLGFGMDLRSTCLPVRRHLLQSRRRFLTNLIFILQRCDFYIYS